MKNRSKALLSIVLTICMIPMVAMGVNASNAKDQKATVTVVADPNCDKYISDASKYGHIVYDLYKVDVSDITDEEKEDYNLLAQNELKKHITANENGSYDQKDTPDIAGTSLGTKLTIEDPGTYLLVARGVVNEGGTSEQIDNDIREVAKVGADGNDTAKSLASHIRIGANYFTVSPQLITAPYKEDENHNRLASSDLKGTWVYDQTVTLKMIGDPDTGSIVINKTLTGYYEGQKEAKRLFQVDVFYPDENTLYSSEVYDITFTSAGEKHLEVQGIPLGSHVKIYEVYSGGNYVSNIAYPQYNEVVVLDSNEKPSVGFINTPKKNNGGGGVTNHFEYKDDGDGIRWFWTQIADNVDTINGRIKEFLQNTLTSDNTQ